MLGFDDLIKSLKRQRSKVKGEDPKWTPLPKLVAAADEDDGLPTLEDPPAPEVVLTDGQSKALLSLDKWLKASPSVFVIRGYAGTGKTFLLTHFMHRNPGLQFYLTAPTNKAAKEIHKATGRGASTIHSFLGLALQPSDGEDGPPTLRDTGKKFPWQSSTGKGDSSKVVVVVDEASMIGKELASKITEKLEDVRVLFLGDPAQLPPIGESKTSVWGLASERHRVLLKEVKRFDNQLLHLSVEIRNCIKTKHYESPIQTDWSKSQQEGVLVVSTERLEKLVLKDSSVEKYKEKKVLAWRNRTVDYWNDLIRGKLGFTRAYEIGDQLLLAAPIFKVVAYAPPQVQYHTDDDFTVLGVGTGFFKAEGSEISVWNLRVQSNSFADIITLRIPQRRSDVDFVLNRLAAEAKAQPIGKLRTKLWSRFWEFNYDFHSVRYGYAMTAHRAQGSTLHTVYCDTLDITANRNKREMMKCLYVACTRPTTALYSN